MSPRPPTSQPPSKASPGQRIDPIAVALRHDLGKPGAPRVVASGRGAIAERIVDLAFESGVKVRHDADLAGLLVAVDLHEEIPFAAFKAVAEILSRIYVHNGTLPARRPGAAGQSASAGVPAMGIAGLAQGTTAAPLSAGSPAPGSLAPGSPFKAPSSPSAPPPAAPPHPET